MASPNQKPSTGAGTFRRGAAFIIAAIGVLLIVIAFALSRLPTSAPPATRIISSTQTPEIISATLIPPTRAPQYTSTSEPPTSTVVPPTLTDPLRHEVDRQIAELEHGDWYSKGEAARTLGKLADIRAVEPLIAALEDEDTGVAMAAAEALGKLGDSRAVEPLIGALEDEGPGVAMAAAEALGRLGDDRAVGPLIAMLRDYEMAMALVEIGESALEPLIAALKDDEYVVKMFAAEALGELGDVRAVGPLVAALEDDDAQQYAQAALVKIGGPAVEPLIVALEDADPEVRRAAVGTLGLTGDARAVEPLLHALRDEAGSVRYSAGYALMNIGEPAVEPLFATLEDGDVMMVTAAHPFLIKIGRPGTEASLIAALYATGDKAMVESFLNSGNSALAKAASEWARENGYTVVPRVGGTNPVKWGSSR